jgi:hypothetical protein
MGKKGREDRKAVKRIARSLGYKETELGELKVTVSKAEARRRWLEREARHNRRRLWEMELIAVISEDAINEIHAIEDARVFSAIEESIHPQMSL